MDTLLGRGGAGVARGGGGTGGSTSVVVREWRGESELVSTARLIREGVVVDVGAGAWHRAGAVSGVNLDAGVVGGRTGAGGMFAARDVKPFVAKAGGGNGASTRVGAGGRAGVLAVECHKTNVGDSRVGARSLALWLLLSLGVGDTLLDVVEVAVWRGLGGGARGGGGGVGGSGTVSELAAAN